MALMLSTSLTKGKTTPCHSQPLETAAPTTFSRLTHDPTVHHVPVWILVLADRVEKREGEKRGGALRCSSYYKMASVRSKSDVMGTGDEYSFIRRI